MLVPVFRDHPPGFFILLWRVGVEEHDVVRIITSEEFPLDNVDADFIEESCDFESASFDLMADGLAADPRVYGAQRLKILNVSRNHHIGIGDHIAQKA